MKLQLFPVNEAGMTAPNQPPIRLDAFWPYQVAVLAERVARLTKRVVREEAALNQSQWRVLAAVAEKPGRLAAEVTAVTPMDKTLVSRAVASLIEAGHITRTPLAQDKRSASLHLTETGQAAYDRIAVRLAALLGTSEVLNRKLKQHVRRVDGALNALDAALKDAG